ncbi:endonuclease V-domain-containing protein [Syncephalis fuscata]|nr:endonuclease V-domain-containing protein [Syncephalis fuscata]
MADTTLCPADDKLLETWANEQLQLKKQLIEVDQCNWQAYLPDIATNTPAKSDNRLKLVAGVDLSFYENDDRHALAALIVQSYPDFKLMYSDFEQVELEYPYKAGYLAFREAPPLLAMLRKLKEQSPELWPQVLFVDGNGTLHPRRFGLACHVGVQADIPTIGEQLTMEVVKQTSRASLLQGGQWFPLAGNSGLVYGAVIATALCCCRYRVPEPVRQADLLSRDYIRRHPQPS